MEFGIGNLESGKLKQRSERKNQPQTHTDAHGQRQKSSKLKDGKKERTGFTRLTGFYCHRPIFIKTRAQGYFRFFAKWHNSTAVKPISLGRSKRQAKNTCPFQIRSGINLKYLIRAALYILKSLWSRVKTLLVFWDSARTTRVPSARSMGRSLYFSIN